MACTPWRDKQQEVQKEALKYNETLCLLVGCSVCLCMHVGVCLSHVQLFLWLSMHATVSPDCSVHGIIPARTGGLPLPPPGDPFTHLNTLALLWEKTVQPFSSTNPGMQTVYWIWLCWNKYKGLKFSKKKDLPCKIHFCEVVFFPLFSEFSKGVQLIKLSFYCDKIYK